MNPSEQNEMNANELRIGSGILYNGAYNKVVSIRQPEPTPDRFKDKWIVEINPPDSFWVCLDELEPIPLDETWLRRAGFVKLGMFWKHVNFMLVQVWEHPEVEGFSMGVKGDAFIVKPSHVHVLQNTVFGIYGTELEFTADPL